MEQKRNPADWIKQAVRALFLFFAVWILGLSLGNIQLKESMEAFGKEPWLTILLLGGSMTLFLVFFLFAKIRLLLEKKYAGIFILLCIALIGILQILCIFKLRIHFRYDALEVYEEACRLLKTGQIANWDYFGANPHQRGTLYLTWFLLKIAASLHIPESMYMVYLDLWCMICVDSCILGAGFVIGREKGLRVMTLYFFMMLLQPFTYLWCLFHYTTVQCLPFMTLLLLLSGVAPQCRKRNQKILLGVVMGVICFIGNKIRPTVLIALIAYVLYVALQWLREWIRKYQSQKETYARADKDNEQMYFERKKTESFRKERIRKVVRPEQPEEPESKEAEWEEAMPEEESAPERTEQEEETEREEPEEKAEGKAAEGEETKKPEEKTLEALEEIREGTEEKAPAENAGERMEDESEVKEINKRRTQKSRQRKEAVPQMNEEEKEQKEEEGQEQKKQTEPEEKEPVQPKREKPETDQKKAGNDHRKKKSRSGKRGRPRAPKTDTLERMEKILNEIDADVALEHSEKKTKNANKSPKVMSASKRNKTIRKTERIRPAEEFSREEEPVEEEIDLELIIHAEELESDFADRQEIISGERADDSDEDMEESETESESEGVEVEPECGEESGETEPEYDGKAWEAEPGYDEEEPGEAEPEYEEEPEEAEEEYEEQSGEAEPEYGEENAETEPEGTEKETGKTNGRNRREYRQQERKAQKKEKARMLGNLAAVAAFVLTFLLLSIGYKALDHKMVTIDTASYERPLLFWVAMSAKGDGTWDGNDAEQLAKFETKEEKEAYTKELIKERLGDLNAGELIGLVSRKLCVTWAKGNDDAINENTDSLSYGKWYDCLLGEESLFFLYYCQIFRILMFACIVFGTVCAFAKRSVQAADYMRIVLLGGILFHLLWEAKPLYSLPFMPFLLVLMTEGLWQLLELSGAAATGDRWRNRKGGTKGKERNAYPVIILSAAAWLGLMIWGFGYGQKLLEQERTIRNYTASQAMERCDIKRGLLANEAVRQEFRADRTFNTIGVQIRNYSWFYGKQNESLYRLTLFDSEDQMLRQALIKGSDFEDYEYCDVSFEPVMPEKGGELYRFLIETVQADDISNLVFYKKASDAIDPYPWGAYVENGVPMEQADLTFRVYQKEYGPVMAKKELLFLILPQILLQLAVLLLSLPGKEETGISRRSRKRIGFSGKDRLI